MEHGLSRHEHMLAHDARLLLAVYNIFRRRVEQRGLLLALLDAASLPIRRIYAASPLLCPSRVPSRVAQLLGLWQARVHLARLRQLHLPGHLGHPRGRQVQDGV